MRIIKIILTLAAFVCVSYFISTFQGREKKNIPTPEVVYGFPTYPGSQFNKLMSGLEGDPFLAVFLSQDPYDKVVQFYKEKLKRAYKLLKYGRNEAMEVYQFAAQPGEVIETFITRGVEVIPLNSRYQSIYHAKTKIKIIIPRKEVLASRNKEKPVSAIQ